MRIVINKDALSEQVKIYMLDDGLDQKHIIHSLMPDGMPLLTAYKAGEVIGDKTYLKMPREHYNAIRDEMCGNVKDQLEKEIQKNKGELQAKELHIENLNQIIDKLLVTKNT